MNATTRMLALYLLASALSGCASIPAEQVDTRIFAWKSLKVEELIKYWGLPSNQRQVGDKFYAEWLNTSSQPGNTSVSFGTSQHSRNSAVGIGFTLFDLGATEDACSRLVTHDEQGNILEISWQGTRNFCYKITPELNKILKNKALIDEG